MRHCISSITTAVRSVDNLVVKRFTKRRTLQVYETPGRGVNRDEEFPEPLYGSMGHTYVFPSGTCSNGTLELGN